MNECWIDITCSYQFTSITFCSGRDIVLAAKLDKNELSINWQFLRNSNHLKMRPATLLNRDSCTGVSCEFCEISKSTIFTEDRRTTVTAISKRKIDS